MPSKVVAHHKARVASFTRSRTPTDAEFIAAKRDLAEAKIAHTTSNDALPPHRH